MSPLIVAVPSKGRLQDNAAGFFARAGLTLVQPGGSRDYRGSFAEAPGIEVAFLSASDITTQLAAGQAHLGITGEDLVRETVSDADQRIALVAPLGFGHANVVVAVPKAWIDVQRMADLEDVAHAMRSRTGQRMRVATKYVNLTRRFFADHGVTDYRIVDSAGATEGAPAAGAAELIVDITTTGSTLAANGLKVLDDGVILRSQAHLAASLAALWADAARDAARGILARVAAEETARTMREVRAAVGRLAAEAVDSAMADLGVKRLGEPGTGGGSARFLCPHAHVFAFCDRLVSLGAGTVTVGALDYVFAGENTVWTRLEQRLPGSAHNVE